MRPSAITLMARAPVPGAVKTRLARATTPDFACALHEALSLDVIEAMAALPVAMRGLALTGEGAARAAFAERARAIDPEIVVSEQPEGDLGARMMKAIEGGRSRGAEVALVVGSDCLDVAACVPRSLDLLGSVDAVLWPACDGGFVLLGASRALPPGLLAGLPWGTERALEATREALEAAGFRVALPGPALPDVDDLPGVRDLSMRLSRGSPHGSRTRRLLAERRTVWE